MTAVRAVAPLERPVSFSSAPGQGFVRVVQNGGRSVVSDAYATSPLRLLTPDNHGHASWVFTSSFGGGMVDGDSTRLRIDVGAGASSYVSSQSSAKIYRSPRGTQADVEVRVAPGGLLILDPDPVVCLAGSRYRQRQVVDLADGAGFVLVDWLTSGRRASGERWAFESYEGRIEIRDRARLIVHESLVLRSSDGPLEARMGRFDVLAVVVVAGAMLLEEAISIVGHVAKVRARRRAEQLISAAGLERGGCVVRIAGRSVEHVRHAIQDCLRWVPDRLGDDPWRRKW